MAPDEIQTLNQHISNWHKLIPGTKLRLPDIPETLKNELDDVEPFIEDYYPKIDISKYQTKTVEPGVENNVMVSEDYQPVNKVEEANIMSDEVIPEAVNNEAAANTEPKKTTIPKKLPKAYPYYGPYPYLYPPYMARPKRKNTSR